MSLPEHSQVRKQIAVVGPESPVTSTQMNSRRKEFFFVNKSKNSSHLSRSLDYESVAIQRHVQTGRKRHRAPKHVRSTSNVVHCSASASNPEDHVPRSVEYEMDDTEASDPNHKSKEISRWSQSFHVPPIQDVHRHGASLMLQKSLSERDPFDASSVPIDKSVAGLLHYYMYYYHPSQWPNEMALLRHGVYVFEEAMMQVLRTAIADKMTMYCLLAAAACRLQYVDKLPCPLVVGKEKGHIIRALQLLSSYIPTADLRDPDQLHCCLTCIAFLNSAEAYRGELSAARTHLDAGLRLLEPVGGISALSSETLRGQFAMGDLFLACIDLRPCSFDCFYDPGPASSLQLEDTEWCAPGASSEACSLLERPESSISPEMRVIIRELVESHMVKTRIITSSMPPSRAKRVTHWITLRNMAIRHRLLAFETTDSRQHVLRIAIIMWTLLAMNITGRAKTVKLMAPKLRENLSTISGIDWSGHEDIKLWILLIGLYCAYEVNGTLGWFLVECRGLMPRCVPLSTANACTSDTTDRMEIFQHNFFYDSQAQSARTRILAERLR